MNKLIYVLAIIFSFYSCSKDNDKYPQKWQLVRMTGQISNSAVTGKDMSWQEYYLFMPNNIFVKHRERNGVITEITGRFKSEKGSDATFLHLEYDAPSNIIGSCYGNEIEELWFRTDDLLINTWSACDGPGLEYERGN